LCFITWLNSALRLHWNIRGFQLILSVSLVQGRKPNIHCRIDSAERANGQPFNCPLSPMSPGHICVSSRPLSISWTRSHRSRSSTLIPTQTSSFSTLQQRQKRKKRGVGLCRQIDAIQDPLFLTCKG